VATSLDSYMPYDAGTGSNVTEDGWRQFARHFRGDGVIRNVGSELSPIGDSTGMQVKVPSGECWIRGQWGSSTATKTLPITTAHATLVRRDLVIVRNDFVNNRIELDVLAGTPGSSSYPPVTQNTVKWELQLAQVTVPAAAVTITSGNVNAIPVYTDGSTRYLVDTGYQTAGNGSDTIVDFDVSSFDSSEISRPSLHEWKILRAGFWLVIFNLYWDNPNAVGQKEAWIQRQGVSTNKLGYVKHTTSTAGGTAQNVVAMDRFAVNDIIEAHCKQDSGVGVQLLGASAFGNGTSITLWWLGP
jgi:hypothetical protein